MSMTAADHAKAAQQGLERFWGARAQHELEIADRCLREAQVHATLADALERLEQRPCARCGCVRNCECDFSAPEVAQEPPVDVVPAAPMSFLSLAYWLHELGTPEEALAKGVTVETIIARARLTVEAYERRMEEDQPVEDTSDQDEQAWLEAQDRREDGVVDPY